MMKREKRWEETREDDYEGLYEDLNDPGVRIALIVVAVIVTAATAIKSLFMFGVYLFPKPLTK